MGGRSMKDVGGTVLAGSSLPFLERERAAVDVDVGPERRSPRYHETCLALESIKEGSAAVSEPRCVWLRVHILTDLEKARRHPLLLLHIQPPARIAMADRIRCRKWKHHLFCIPVGGLKKEEWEKTCTHKRNASIHNL